MNLGAEPKKVAILAGLIAVAGASFVFNSSSSPEGDYSPARTSPVASSPAPAADAPAARPARPRANQREFRPSVRRKKGEAAPDPTTIDPTLRVDILAKLQQIKVEGTHRSIFDFGQPPPPPAPKPVEAKGPPAPNPLVSPAPVETAEVKPPAPPQAPPVPMKFFGYISPANQPNKRAFFVEGEDIHVVHEGEVVNNRYKIVRIGVNSVVVEDLQFKSEQTVPLEEQTT